MNQPFLRRIKSYFVDVLLEARKSEINPVLDLYLVKGRFQLCTANSIYSFDDLYDNFVRGFKAVNIKKEDPKSALVLGLGMASIPLILEKKFKVRPKITAIELDEEVIDLASEYVLKHLENPIEVVCADAEVFVQLREDHYDLICSDVFVDDEIPEDLKQIPFLEALKERLTPNGLLMYNCLYRSILDVESSDDFYENYFKKVFPESTAIDVKGNLMLVNRKL